MGDSTVAAIVVVLLVVALIVIVMLAILSAYVQAQHRRLQLDHDRQQDLYDRLSAQYEETQSRYVGVQTRLNDLARQQFDAWRSKELDAMRQQIEKAAQEKALAAAERWFVENESKIRDDAVRRSTSVVAGKVTEHLTPYIGRFRYNPKDVRFLGAPVDLVVFDGMSDGDLRQIVFLEIKTGAGSLSTRERRIRDVVVAKRVVWEEFHLPTTNGTA